MGMGLGLGLGLVVGSVPKTSVPTLVGVGVRVGG